jgi:twinkle protein
MRATEIARRLSAQVDGVVRELLPRGRKVGREWRCGGLDGDPGDSLGVHLGGEKAGVWSDFSTGEKGDLIGLWMSVRALSLADACKEALNYLGISDDTPARPQRTYRKPDKAGVSRVSPQHAAWLRDERKLPDESVAAYKLASRDGKLMFPYIVGDELVFAKYRRLFDASGAPIPKKQQFSAESECEPVLFGWQAINPCARAVCIVEGELDAIAMHAYGFPSLSVPNGARSHGWIENEFDRLAVFDTIYLVFDNDAAGKEPIDELVSRLGRERVRVVTLPGKDANDCLKRGVERAEIIDALRKSRTIDPAELRNVGEFEDAVIAEYTRVDDGMCLPWPKTYDTVKLRLGETSIWAGVNGHGKSVLVSQVVGNLACSGVMSCVASMEFRTPMWLMKMNRQIAGVEAPTEPFARHINRRLSEVMWAFHVHGAAKADRILEVFRYARRRYRTELFVIDNLSKCGFADDDYSGQKLFVEALTDFARDEHVHVAIVAHMRKGETEDKPGGKFAVKGSGGITDMVDTVFEVWRNKPRERAIAKAEASQTELEEKWAKASDAILSVHKQRATGIEPMVHLWFDKTTTQFLSSQNHAPRPMLDYSAVGVDRAA